MLRIKKEEVEHIAHLSRLDLEDTEIETFTYQLNQILEAFQKLNEVETENIPSTSHVVQMQNVFREDELKDSSSIDRVLKNAPDSNEDYFFVPKVIE